MSIEDELIEIENYIKTLDMNDDTHKEINKMIDDGMSKGLIYNFVNLQEQYKGTMFSSQVIKKEEYDNFQAYINKCQEKQQKEYREWKDEITNSGVEFSKDELKYYKII